MWKPLGNQGSLSERIVAQVEELIDSERLRPGDRLPPEREMARLLAVSRPSLREAVRILEARGRLTVKHGQGVFVAAPRSERELRAAVAETQITLNDLYAMRELLEVPAAGWAAENIEPRQLSELRTILDKLNAAAEAAAVDYDELGQLDAIFHLTIAAAAGNRFLLQTSNVLSDVLLSGMQTTLHIPGRIQRARRDHERIYAALDHRDPSAARRAARSHIRGAHVAALKRVP